MKRIARQFRPAALLREMRKMGIGSWIVVAVLLLLLAWAASFAHEGWSRAGGADVPNSGYIALVLGILFSVGVGVGLMALVFYSSRYGYDEPARRIDDDEHE